MLVEDYLQERGIAFQAFEHPSAFTCEEAELHCAHVPGLAVKNLFITNKARNRFFLVILPAKKRMDFKLLGTLLQEKNLVFATPEELLIILGLTPGSVSLFGILNDSKGITEICIDKEVYEAEQVGFHPNRNTATLVLAHDMLLKFLADLAQPIHILQ